MTRLKERREIARWEESTRAWATDAAREMVYNICTGGPLAARPYNLGVVLGATEVPWIEFPARFLNEGEYVWGTREPVVRPWLVTSERIVGRLGDGRLYGWRWDSFIGCRASLVLGYESVVLDDYRGQPLAWVGPAVAPLAITAIYWLHGAPGLIEHPSLNGLK